MNRQAKLGPILVPMATPLICRKVSSLKEKVFMVRTSSARRMRVDVGGSFLERLLRKCWRALSPSEWGMQV